MSFELNTDTDCKSKKHWIGIEIYLGAELIGDSESFYPNAQSACMLFLYCPNCGAKLKWPAEVEEHLEKMSLGIANFSFPGL